MKSTLQKLPDRIALVLLGLALSAPAAFGSQVITVNTFDTSSSISGVWDWYGGSTLTWDGTEDHTGDGGGSLHISKNTSNDHIFDVESFSGNTWDNGSSADVPPDVFDLTLYTNLSIWIKWDTTTSTMTLSDFNANYGLSMELNDNHLGQYDWSGNGLHNLPQVQIPDAASNGWVNLNFPISSQIPYINQIGSIVFNSYHPVPWDGSGSTSVAFWVDDITFQPSSVTALPPPKVSAPVKATPGLNVFASSAGLYDRQSAVLRQTNGLSWVGQATAANPVTYSFTIAGYPNSVNCEAYLFLVPNPDYEDSAPDWNETNCAIFYLQGSATSATAYFRYKVNEDSQQAMYSGGNETRALAATTNNYYYTAAPGTLGGVAITNELSPGVYNITNESGNLAALANNTILGTWTIKFTSDTNVSVIAPGGSTTNFVVPPYNAGYFAEQGVTGFRVYLGMQANNVDAQNQAVVYSNFAVTGTAQPFSDNFLADSVLDTTNTWDTSPSPGSAGIFIAPAGSAFWLSWTLPDSGFSLETAPTLTNLLAWTSPSTGPIIAMNSIRSQLVASNEVPSGSTAFFRLVKRVATQLQVLLPGETNAPNTTTGKTGTPTPLSFSASGGLVNVTINSVDSTWHLVNTTDVVHLTDTDTSGNGATPSDTALQGGTLTEQVAFGATGAYTVTASDTTSTNILSNTSSSITVGP